jgi:hypothetical protein
MDIHSIGASLIRVERAIDRWMDGHDEAAFFMTVQMHLQRLQKFLGEEHLG